MGEKLFTAKEAAEILKVRKNTVYDMIKRGDLKASKLGKQLRIRQEDLDFYIQYGSQAKVVDSRQGIIVILIKLYLKKIHLSYRLYQMKYLE